VGKKKVSELEGAQLDYAVAVASGFTRARMSEVYAGEWVMPDGRQMFAPWFKPSTDWAHGGPIIEREQITIDCRKPERWLATGWEDDEQYGPTPLIAAMRAFVASKLGDEVEVPS
jgi:hypothetical protein